MLPELEVMEEEKKHVDTLVDEVQKLWPSYKVSPRTDSIKDLPVDADFQGIEDRDSDVSLAQVIPRQLQLVPDNLRTDEALLESNLERRTKYVS